MKNCLSRYSWQRYSPGNMCIARVARVHGAQISPQGHPQSAINAGDFLMSQKVRSRWQFLTAADPTQRSPEEKRQPPPQLQGSLEALRWEQLVGDQDEQVPRHHLLLHQPGGAAVTAGAPAVLGAAGFTSSGVAGGSLAAAVQVFDQLTWAVSESFFVHSRPCMRGPPLQVAGLPLAHPLRWEVRWELLLLLLLLPRLGLRLLLEPATASIAWLRRKKTQMPCAPGVVWQGVQAERIWKWRFKSRKRISNFNGKEGWYREEWWHHCRWGWLSLPWRGSKVHQKLRPPSAFDSNCYHPPYN